MELTEGVETTLNYAKVFTENNKKQDSPFLMFEKLAGTIQKSKCVTVS